MMLSDYNVVVRPVTSVNQQQRKMDRSHRVAANLERTGSFSS